MSDLFAEQTAVISDCKDYRYRLERAGPGRGRTVVIMVNPSTADAEEDDQTIRKLKGFGARHQWGRIIVGNLFAYRATDVGDLATADDPIGPLNDEHLLDMLSEADRLIFAWGRVTKLPKWLRFRWRTVAEMAGHLNRAPYCIGPVTQCGHPAHPLTLSYSLPIERWIVPA